MKQRGLHWRKRATHAGCNAGYHLLRRHCLNTVAFASLTAVFNAQPEGYIIVNPQFGKYAAVFCNARGIALTQRVIASGNDVGNT
jgi:hypothetical protein